ncbi:hypothetical protein EFS01_05805, partial [Lactobacillus amylovorus]
HFKNKKHRNSLKIMNFCVFISGLKIEFFPRHVNIFKLLKHVISSHWQILTRRALGKQVLDNIDIA